jgi:eukaryotic-like serine/threonine-protein kinase
MGCNMIRIREAGPWMTPRTYDNQAAPPSIISAHVDRDALVQATGRRSPACLLDGGAESGERVKHGCHATPERWRQVKEIFFLAVDCDVGTRPSLLAARCGDDGALMTEVEALLAEHESLARADESTLPGRQASLVGFRGNGRFSLEAELGAGGFGVVYRAFDRKLGHPVALKVLHDPHGEGLVQFKREFRAIAQLRLPNLVRCHELFSEERNLFFTMELVDGVPILEHLRGDRHGDPGQMSSEFGPEAPAARDRDDPHGALAAVFAQLARGVLDLHAAGWLHRDLKPSNVLVDRSGRVVILDLGLVRSMDDPHRSTQLFGSPCYIAPELFSHAPPTAASDWYSVGVMLYEALTGRIPWSATWLDLVLEKTAGEPPSPRSLVPEIPSHLDELCASLLRRDPRQRPAGAEVLRRLADGDLASVPSVPAMAPAPSAPFVGRVDLLAALHQAFARCAGGLPVVVEVTGTSGIGKTALVRRFLESLRAQQPGPVVVLEGRCYEHESIGYKVFDGVVDALALYLRRLPAARAEALLPRNLHELSQVFPVLLQATVTSNARRRTWDGPSTDGLELRRKAFDAFRELLGRIAEKHPLVIFVDDVQWGDQDSVAPLCRLLSADDAPPFLLVVTYRTELADNPVLADLRQAFVDAGVVHRRLEVGALAPEDARRFAELLLGEDHPAIPAVVAESGGLPYFLDELLGHARAESADGARLGHELRLEQLLLDRIQRLPTDARRLLEMLSVARKPLPLETALVAADLADEGACAPLYAGRLARPSGTHAVEPYHDRIREVIEAALDPGRRTDAHRRLGRALEDHRGDAEQMAVHFRAAGDVERALRYAIKAAQEADAQAAFNRAARLYGLAVELGGGGADLLAKLGDAQANAGQGRMAAASYAAAAGQDPADGQELLRRAAEQLLRVGEIEQGLSLMSRIPGARRWSRPGRAPAMLAWIVLRGAWQRLRGLGFRPREAHDVPRALLLRVDLAWTAFLGFFFANPIRAAFIHGCHLLDALKTGEPGRVVRALAAEAALAGMRGKSARYARLMAELDRASGVASGPGERHWPGFARAIAGFGLGRWAECRKDAMAAEQAFMAKGQGASWELSIVRALVLATTMLAGEVRGAQRRLQEHLRDCEERGDLFARACLTFLGSSHLLRLAHGEPELAQRELQDLLRLWPAARLPLLDYNAGYALAETALYMGRLDEAWAFFAERPSPSRRALLHATPILRVFFRHLRARVAIARSMQDPARREGLLQIAASEARALQAERAVGACGLANLVLAAIASQRGDRNAAKGILEIAEDKLETEGLRPLLMTARIVRGHLTGDEEGRILVQQGESWAAEQGVRQAYRMIAVFVPGVL